jgi:uncharacterized short protein YbdD (DUF466 family)
MPFADTHPNTEPRPREFYSIKLGIRLRRVLRIFWRGLREWCGDAAYERYSRAAATKACPAAKMTPSEFYVDSLNRRYSRLNRCC